ncbi:MAG: putative membrane protein [Candidatus Accumulibacter sp. BA-94]|uniref:NnrU family protein n=1 Tax=Accumulibacter sp. TaxID=2053492 RepID=UPI00044BB3F5|nr:NnrU family protein [Accumulibacter sp.]EXI89703.1 MAG: putative membrane protein [Candidatus Accumulibacter sp. BA-94]HRD90228.1 NnrU family protein [Accumulibacter sp.]
MTLLILGLATFLGVHSIRIFAAGFRDAQMAKLGPNGWKALYSIVSIAGFVLIVYGYADARMTPVAVWSPPPWTGHLAALLTIPAFILLAAAYVPGTRIKRAVGHPMVAGVKVWAFAHLIANGTLADVLLFGSFFAWAILDYASARRRDRAACTEYVAGPITRDLSAVVAGLAAWTAFAFWLHAWLIGVRPFGG